MARCCEVGIGAFIQTITAICFMSTILLVFQCFVILLSSHSAKLFVADVYWVSAKTLVAGDLEKNIVMSLIALLRCSTLRFCQTTLVKSFISPFI